MSHVPASLAPDPTRLPTPSRHRPPAGVQADAVPEELPRASILSRGSVVPAADPLRQTRVVLGLQRTHGNAHVQRTIAELRRRADPPAEPVAASVQRDDDDEKFPTPQIGPVNIGLHPGGAAGGRIGFGAPLSPFLPDAGPDPRDGGRPGPFDPRLPGDTRGGSPEEDKGATPSWGIGLQGRYGEEEQAVGLGAGFTF